MHGDETVWESTYVKLNPWRTYVLHADGQGVHIIRDAIAYIENLQEQERQLLAEISALQSSNDDTAAAVKMEGATTGGAGDDVDSFPWRKKLR